METVMLGFAALVAAWTWLTLAPDLGAEPDPPSGNARKRPPACEPTGNP